MNTSTQEAYLESMGMSSALITAMKLKESKLTDEERRANKARFEQLQRERRIKASIIQNVCPSCQGKLTRGKKNKKNDYKRTWTCNSCPDSFSM